MRLPELHSRVDRLEQLAVAAQAHAERIDRLEDLLFESKEETWERSRRRWRQSQPDPGLTWGREVTGGNFISKASSYGAITHEKTVLEIGPGYGRLLRACLDQGIRFKKYVAVDISLDNVKYLQETFPIERVSFIHGDIENISFDDRFDVMLSSLTFKHLFPSFEQALSNVVQYMNPGGLVFFDLIEGDKKYFEKDSVTYIRWYTRADVLEILGNVSLDLVAFDHVQHDPGISRLLVVATTPGLSLAGDHWTHAAR